MARELRVSAAMELPDDLMQRAEALMRVKGALEAFTEAMEDAGGTVTYEEVTPRPRGEKPDPVAGYVALGGKVAA